MPDEQKLLMALIAAGLALLGTLFTAIMNYRSQRKQDRSKAASDREIADFKARTDKDLADFKATTDREIADFKARTDKDLVGFKADMDKKLTRLNAALQAERDKRLAQLEAEKIISKFRDPLMHAAYDLQSRIFNILKKDFLPTYYTNGSKREQEYAVENTVFLLAQFLGWTELIRQEIQFLDLSNDDQTRELRQLQDSLYTQLQADHFGPGFRLFAGEQRAVGELMIDRATGVPRCMGFATFLQDRKPAIDYWLDPLREDVKRMSADYKPFEGRLVSMQHTLIDLLQFLDPKFMRFPQASRTKI
jgi:hypothetical protein